MLIFLICTFHTVLYCQVSTMVWSYNAAYASSLRFAFQNRSLRCVFHVAATSSLMENNKDVVKRYVVFGIRQPLEATNVVTILHFVVTQSTSFRITLYF